MLYLILKTSSINIFLSFSLNITNHFQFKYNTFFIWTFTFGQSKLPFWHKLHVYCVYSTAGGMLFLLCKFLLLILFCIKDHMEDFVHVTQNQNVHLPLLMWIKRNKNFITIIKKTNISSRPYLYSYSWKIPPTEPFKMAYYNHQTRWI